MFLVGTLKHHAVNPGSELTYAVVNNSSRENTKLKYIRFKVQTNDKPPFHKNMY